MQSKMFLPHLMAVIILLKLSSINMIPAAALAISVPCIPIANPISASFRASASFVPSPVTATTLSHDFNPMINKNLSSGVLLDRTLRYLFMSLNFFFWFSSM